MTWEITAGIFTIIAAFISVVTVAVKVNRAIVLLEEAVKRLDGYVDGQEKLNDTLNGQISDIDRRLVRLELKANNNSRKKICKGEIKNEPQSQAYLP